MFYGFFKKEIVKLSLISSEILHFEVRRCLPGKCKMDKSRFKVYFLFCHSKYSSTCHGRSLGWTATCFGRPLLRCTNYFAMLKYLHPTATCLTRPADSKMLDFIPAKAVNCHGSFQICGDYCDKFWSTHYTVDKCCWFVHTFSALSVSSLTVGLYSIVIDRCAS